MRLTFKIFSEGRVSIQKSSMGGKALGIFLRYRNKVFLLFCWSGNKAGVGLGSAFRHGLGQESRAVTLENGISSLHF